MARGWSKNVAVADYVPADNNDLVRHYESYVTRLVTRYNRVSTNFKDLLQHVWMKLIENKVIDKYHASGSGTPKTLTAIEACTHLNMKFDTFKTALWRHKKGDDREKGSKRAPTAMTAAVFERDRGCCYRCGQDMDRLQRVLQSLKDQDGTSLPEFQGLLAIVTDDAEVTLRLSVKKSVSRWRDMRQSMLDNHGISLWQKVFWFAEMIPGRFGRNVVDNYRTLCLFCAHTIYPQSSGTRRRSTWAPMPIKGGYMSRDAVYNYEDIERFRQMREADKAKGKKSEAIVPAPVVSSRKALFKAYLATAVHNIYANWCRTRSRRYKEEYRGDKEDGTSWDAFLEDSKCRPDDMVDLYHTSKMIAAGEEDIRDVDLSSTEFEETQEKVLSLIADGYTLADVVNKLSLPVSVIKAVAYAG